ncbi:hypothetical protein [Paenibacillus qinlingensis]|uniref:Sulfur relay (Sulfurtransferase) DsrF/TusC family protein n=1 Tax=Paenibacillus qinlingensis TaxID=1837343 RepID=A0ABU1NQP0_9BACL|nr:hypothetical protein [Paenibacillus qinlingensis]MDR6549798.1 sulfur relay (sulfurtransferase) DsrF/TusC family protein [Paenibacillus qinlingensis]
MMNPSHNFRFIERDYWYQKALCDTDHLLPEQIDALLDDAHSYYADYTFKFYNDGSVTIIDNDTNNRIKPKELTGAVYDFYIRKRIYMIKANLIEKQLQHAN